MKIRPAIFLILSLGLQLVHVEAQRTYRHNCWDIDLSKKEQALPTSPFLPPHIISANDSGLMLVALAKEYIGTPYRYGGRSPKGFDCAGFALFLYRHFGRELPSYSGGQARSGLPVNETRNLQPGDLVLFGARHHTHTIGHTGVVVSADTASGIFHFIHASTSAGVIISRSNEPYYKERYICARRIFTHN